MTLEEELLALAASGGCVVLSTARGGWKAATSPMSNLAWDAVPSETVRYTTGRTPSGALKALREGRWDEEFCVMEAMERQPRIDA